MRTPTPPGGLRPALITFAVTLSIVFAPAAHAAVRHDQLPLHAGSSGPRVAGLQWMISGAHSHRPNVFTVRGTFNAKPNGWYGARTKAAVVAYKYRIGYPKAGQCGARTTYLRPVAGTYFFKLLRNLKQRPACWVALASARVKAIIPGASPVALKVKALLVSQLGVSEQPDGSNRGPRISYSVAGVPSYQSSTGAYGAAWCVSTAQWALKQVGYGTFAGATAGVYAAADWAAAHNFLSAKPKVGEVVAFIEYDRSGRRIPGTGHMGFVVKIEANSFTYIAGNDGNAVREHTIPAGSRPYAFIALPGVA